VAANVTDLSSC